MQNEKIISIRNASLMLGGREILRDINWEVRRGDNWFILGANGAGKTTLTKMLLGLAWPKFGAEISVLGNRYGNCDIFEVRKKIAWISPFLQNWTSARWTSIEVVLSGIDCTVGLYRKVSSKERRKALETMDSLDSAKFAERPFEFLSSGEQIKVLIARSMMTSPAIMILDEACVHLDMKSREFLLESVDAFVRKPDSPSVLFITQRIEEILPVFNMGLVLKDGGILAAGPRKEILTDEILLKAFEIPLKLHHSKSGRIWLTLN
ncbi:MAG: ATP-binding cassette domain-containing protein [Victivallales bacterium]|jgi:iron complex transport system ATP-binding protein